MATEVSMSQDCKTLHVTDGPSLGTYQLYYNNFISISDIWELTIPLDPYDPVNNPYVQVSSPTLNSSGGISLTSNNIGNALEEKMNGVFFLVITDGAGDMSSIGLVSSCDIKCCLAKKLEKLLECNCASCEECTTLLDETSKIYLLLKGSEINAHDCVSTLEQFQKAYNKYKKAKEMCGAANCNCNC